MRNELTIVRLIPPASPMPPALGPTRYSSAIVQLPPAPSIFARAGREAVGGHVELLRDLALAEDLHRHAGPSREAVGLQRVRRDRVAVAVARLEVAQVHRLRLRAERLERHRLLHVRAAQLAHP